MLFRLLIIAICCSTVFGCAQREPGRDLLEIAQLEEKQGNLRHAAKLYEDVVLSHPGSQSAKTAAERLEVVKKKIPE